MSRRFTTQPYTGQNPHFGTMSQHGAQTRFIHALRAALGTPYAWGGASKAGFDCSGLVYWAAKLAGIHGIPRTTYQQIDVGRPVGMRQLRPGDLVFSDFEGTGKPTHVVVYIGHGRVIAAPHRGEDVQVEPLSAFQGHIVGARRILAHPNGQVVSAQRFGVPQGGGGQNPAAMLAAIQAMQSRAPALPQLQIPKAGPQLAAQIQMQQPQFDPSRFIAPPPVQATPALGQAPLGATPAAFAQQSLDTLHRKLLSA